MTLANGIMLGVIVVLVLILVYERYSRRKQISQIQQDRTANELYYDQTWRDNETLRAYMDNKHLVWSEFAREEINKRPLDPDLVVLIRAVDLYDLSQKQWQDGYDLAAVSSGKAMQMRYGVDNKKDDEGVTTIRSSFADKRFDNDFSKLVNSLTALGINYGQTQQLRDRVSRQVIDFRMYLAKKQRGERVEFPKV